MSKPQLKVLVVGAGIAGPCFIYWLKRSGLDVHITVVERSPKPRSTGQAVDIRGGAVDVVKLMGLREKIQAEHTTETGLAFVDTNGKIIAQFDATGDEKRQSGTSEYEILRADLARLFMEKTDGLDNVKYMYGDSIRSIDQAGSTAEVVFDSGKEDSFDLVVGADGSSSRVRSLVLGEDAVKDGYTMLGQYIGYFSIPSKPDDPKLWQWYNAPGGRLLSIRPHKDPSTCGAYLGVTMPAKEQRDPRIEEALKAEGNDAIKSLLHEYFKDAGFQAERILAGLDQSTDFYMSRSCRVKMSAFHAGRTTLVGDAASTMFGSGTALAIQGAYVLAGELSKINDASEVPGALQKYDEVFRPLVNKSIREVPGGLQIANPQTGFGISVMNWILWTACTLRVHKLFRGGAGETDWVLPEYDWKPEAAT